MPGYHPILDYIDTRSFSSVWYWIAVAGTWAVATYRPLGVPFDMVLGAQRAGGDEAARLESVARAFALRLVTGVERGGTWLVAASSAAYTALALLGFYYGVELAQAVLLLTLPLSVAAVATVGTAQHIAAGMAEPAVALRRLRRTIQALGIISIFVAAVWGMYVNLGRSVV